MASIITRIAEAIVGTRLCDHIGHRWGVTVPSPSGRPHPRPVKMCGCCGCTEELPSSPPPGHPDTMTSGVTAEQAAWLARVDMELTEGAS